MKPYNNRCPKNQVTLDSQMKIGATEEKNLEGERDQRYQYITVHSPKIT